MHTEMTQNCSEKASFRSASALRKIILAAAALLALFLSLTAVSVFAAPAKTQPKPEDQTLYLVRYEDLVPVKQANVKAVPSGSAAQQTAKSSANAAASTKKSTSTQTNSAPAKTASASVNTAAAAVPAQPAAAQPADSASSAESSSTETSVSLDLGTVVADTAQKAMTAVENLTPEDLAKAGIVGTALATGAVVVQTAAAAVLGGLGLGTAAVMIPVAAVAVPAAAATPLVLTGGLVMGAAAMGIGAAALGLPLAAGAAGLALALPAVGLGAAGITGAMNLPLLQVPPDLHWPSRPSVSALPLLSLQ